MHRSKLTDDSHPASFESTHRLEGDGVYNCIVGTFSLVRKLMHHKNVWIQTTMIRVCVQPISNGTRTVESTG